MQTVMKKYIRDTFQRISFRGKESFYLKKEIFIEENLLIVFLMDKAKF